MGRTNGVSEEELMALGRYKESDLFGSTDKLVLDLAVAMTNTPPVVDDELFGKLQELFTTAQLVELATAISQENFRGRFNRMFKCAPAGFSDGSFCPMPEVSGVEGG